MKVKKMLAAGMAVTMAATLGLTGCSGGGDTADSLRGSVLKSCPCVFKRADI